MCFAIVTRFLFDHLKQLRFRQGTAPLDKALHGFYNMMLQPGSHSCISSTPLDIMVELQVDMSGPATHLTSWGLQLPRAGRCQVEFRMHASLATCPGILSSLSLMVEPVI